MDLVLGINWLQTVNPIIGRSSGVLYIPDAVHTALIQGSWLEAQIKVGILLVVSGEERPQELAMK